MVSFDQRIVLPAETQSLISTLTFVFFLLAVAFAILSAMIYQLTMAIRTQNEILGMRNRIQARMVEGKGK
jgi:predicted outer membrane lipoprotein